MIERVRGPARRVAFTRARLRSCTPARLRAPASKRQAAASTPSRLAPRLRWIASLRAAQAAAKSRFAPCQAPAAPHPADGTCYNHHGGGPNSSCFTSPFHSRLAFESPRTASPCRTCCSCLGLA
ncbi:hypothetical protein ZWY2020_028774 [Hordeum vulgare]|nr:hypothetical protein ZWY2020_028774 [Hordeum vulgare]